MLSVGEEAVAVIAHGDQVFQRLSTQYLRVNSVVTLDLPPAVADPAAVVVPTPHSVPDVAPRVAV